MINEGELAKELEAAVLKPSLGQSITPARMPKADEDIRSSSEHISDAMNKLEQILKDAGTVRAALDKIVEAVRELNLKLDAAIGEVSKAKSRL